MARYFLAFVGLAYITLGVWCAVAPEKTSNAVGFVLQPGQGQSEFFTAYGGLEVGLGIVFLWPLFRRQETAFALVACVVVHACLVFFRTLSFFVFTDFEKMTYILASTEWTIFLIAAVVHFWRRRMRLVTSGTRT